MHITKRKNISVSAKNHKSLKRELLQHDPDRRLADLTDEVIEEGVKVVKAKRLGK